LDVLLYLLENRQRVVGSAELLREVWRGVKIQPNTLTQTVATLRRALDDEDGSRIIETVRTRGYRFVASLSPRERTGTAEPSLCPAPHSMVGREREVAGLAARLESALQGTPNLVLITGAPGVGKTRLLTELGNMAKARGARLAVARCPETPRAPELWPWLDLVRQLASASLLELIRASAAAAWLPELFPDVPRATAESNGAESFVLFQSLLALLREAASQDSVVLVLDDLNWADPASWLFLGFLARGLGNSKLLLALSYSEGQLTPTQARVVGATLREDASRRMCLGSLRPEDVGSMLESEVGKTPPETMARLLEKTGGNPALLQQLLSASSPASSIRIDDTSALLSDETVRAAIEFQFAALSEPCLALLSTAAVLGRRFQLSRLCELTSVDRALARDGLEEALRMKIVRRTGTPDELCFEHGLVRDVLLRRLSAAQRQELTTAQR
ncbi:MAG TPA: AAA family ATPase, partial [Polyangiaceae bacterium]|nr:AAA family ATPase [Polyangiaceae bacterium]